MTSSSACSVSTQFPRADAVFFLPKTCKRVKLFMLFRTLEGAVEGHLRAPNPHAVRALHYVLQLALNHHLLRDR